MTGTTVIIIFLVLLVIRVPLAFSMAMAGIAYVVVDGLPISISAQRMINAINSFPLLAVPLFIFAGHVFNVAGVTNSIFRLARLFLGRQPGGMAQVNVGASLVFSGMSGAALADIGGLGNIEIRAMTDQGYRKSVSAAITVASATIGPIFPPSIPLIIYAVVASASSLQLLLAGIVPALLLTAFLMVQLFFIARRNPKDYPVDPISPQRGDRRRAFVSALPALFAPVLLISGLLVGAFSPTEIAAVTLFYAIILGVFVYRELTLAKFMSAVALTVRTTSSILIIASASGLFSLALTFEGVPQQLSSALLGISDNRLVLLLLVNVLLLIVGMFMDTIAALLVVVPLLVPPLVTAGVDPIHLGVVVVLNLMIGLLTPPVGMSLYLISDIAKVKVEEVVKEVIPFLIPLFLALIVLTLVPEISLWLPGLF
ncbi:MAG: TRAP transporter large permease [Trueperaceae bacterium]